MDMISAKPNLLKKVNLAQIRKILATKETATRGDLVHETGISSTTIRALLGEMIKNNEVESIGYDASSGGRKAERYALCKNRYLGAAFCCRDRHIHTLLVNMRGEILDISESTVENQQYEEAIISIVDSMIEKFTLNVIGIGIPGVVEGESYLKKHIDSDTYYKIPIGEHITARYGIPVILENDMNATTIGFGRCYEKMFPTENPKNTNMAYLHFDQGCVSAGFLLSGQIVRGYGCFSGELGLVPVAGDKLLDAIMQETMDDETYIKWIAHILGWVCGILNPQYIALSGTQTRQHCIGSIGDRLFSLLPNNMFAELIYAPEKWSDYYEGMAYLTGDKIFQSI